ncbi:MAG: hypothetical protein RL322_2937 [Pseudomonadota bacterium]|jgi:basic membrane protein A
MSTPRVAVVLFGPPGQGSFNESGAAGAERARARFPGARIETHWIVPREPAARTSALRDLCTQGFDLIVAHGGQGDEPVRGVAADFPSTAFSITQGGWVSGNCSSYEVLQEQSAFLAGVLAAHHSRTGVVAHLSGERVRPGLKGRAAFAHGVRASGRGCSLVTGFCGHQHEPERAYAMMKRILAAGADVVFAMIDGGRPGVSQACREAGITQIGNVLDWVSRDPEVFIASAIADSGACAEEAIEDFMAGRWQAGSHVLHGVAEPRFARLLMRAEVEAQQGSMIAGWSALLASGQVQPEEQFSGPELPDH